MSSVANMAGWPRPKLLLQFHHLERPDGGAEVVSEFAAPISYARKEPVGLAFQIKVLKKHGFFGTSPTLVSQHADGSFVASQHNRLKIKYSRR